MFKTVIRAIIPSKVSNEISTKITCNILLRNLSVYYKNNFRGYGSVYSTKHINRNINLLYHVPLFFCSSNVDHMNLEQTPNRQIWLSSPTSGPKRYDFVKGKWVYKYDEKTLHELLNNEISVIVKKEVSFDKCFYSGKE
ncbi:hypothetical protein M0804_009480 [Polistes exclamans]|nr:hypothetical protein M0804_009480 [Polistes exclamans]